MTEHTGLTPPPRATERTGYIHSQTCFQHNRWSAHDLIGELMAREITQISLVRIDGDWTVSWLEPIPPNVITQAEQTPP